MSRKLVEKCQLGISAGFDVLDKKLQLDLTVFHAPIIFP